MPLLQVCVSHYSVEYNLCRVQNRARKRSSVIVSNLIDDDRRNRNIIPRTNKRVISYYVHRAFGVHLTLIQENRLWLLLAWLIIIVILSNCLYQFGETINHSFIHSFIYLFIVSKVVHNIILFCELYIVKDTSKPQETRLSWVIL